MVDVPFPPLVTPIGFLFGVHDEQKINRPKFRDGPYKFIMLAQFAVNEIALLSNKLFIYL